ncbi:MAG: imidazoleglycerol-phosphate dehydratase HisB [Clostridia bacterium]|nr:imidazoleglycerol-phosphate dehydratase HisB [Clostridia bacterium]
MRTAEIARQTLETKIELTLNLDGEGKSEVATGIGFLNHMLVLLAKHAFLDLTVKASGDLEVDSHHTVEDCGIVLGQALKKAVGDKTGMHRYGSCFLPMDEALAHVVLDFSGRPFLVWQAEIPKVTLGNLEAEMVEEFFRAVAAESGMTLHVRLLYGRNTHHIIEAIFKAFARALAEGVAIDSRVKGVMSSKGKL